MGPPVWSARPAGRGLVTPPDRRQVVFGGMLLAASGLGVIARPSAQRRTMPPDELSRAIPARIGRYAYRTSDDIILPQRDEVSLRVYQQYVARIYAADGLAPVTMLVAYGASQDYALQIHRPESCYPMAGFAIGRSVPVELPLGTGRRIAATALTATRLGRQEQILYWTRVGESYPATLWQQRAVTARLALARRPADGVLVRLSSPQQGPAGIAALARFNALLLTSIAPAARAIMLGPTA